MYTHGTHLAQITLNNKTVPQKFHVVPNTVRMHEFDAILGIDFLSENGIIIDYGRRIVYTNPDNIQIIYKPSILPILKHNKASELKNTIKITEKSALSTCQNAEKSIIKDENLNFPLIIAEKDVIYTNNENLLDKFVENKFSAEILNEIDRNGYKILLGCKNGKIFCLKDRDYVNNPSPKTNLKKAIINQTKNSPSVAIVDSINTYVEEVHEPNYNIFMINGNTDNEIYNQNNKRRLIDSIDSCSEINFLKNLCSPDISICNINDGNVAICFMYFLAHIKKFVNSINKGTSLNAIVTTLNVYNQVMIEIKKYLIRYCLRNNDSNLEKFSISLGKATIDFKDIIKNNFCLGNLLQYLSLLRKQLIRVCSGSPEGD